MKPHLPQQRQAAKEMFPFIYSKIRFLACMFSKTILWRNKWKSDKFLFSVSEFLPTVCKVLWFVSVYVHRQEQLRKIVRWSDIKSDFQLFKALHSMLSRCFILLCVAISVLILYVYYYLWVTWICLIWASFRSANKCTFLSYNVPFVVSKECLILHFL